MALDIAKTLNVGGIYSSMQIVPSRKVQFGNQNSEDKFEYTSLNKYTNENAIKKMIATNPKVTALLKGLPVELNMEDLTTLLQGHAKDTQNIAKGIIENLPFALKTHVDEKAISDAAYLHDIGKVLIPGKILNKNGKLNTEETEIMHRHSELGYEMLKTTDINNKTLNLIRNHHQNMKRSGYPFVQKDFHADLNLQIVSVADKYSALTEKRVYKDSMSPQKALTIIYRDVQEEKLHPFVFRALANYVKTSQSEKINV